MLLSGREWYSHVGEHLYELAVFALQPSLWQTIAEDESSNNGSNKTIGSLSVGCEDSGTPLSLQKSETGAELRADFSRRLREHGAVQKEHFTKDWAIGFQMKSQQEQYLPQKMPNYEGAGMEAVGLADSIGGLVCIASQVCRLCYNYFSEVMNAQADIKQFVSELSSLAKLLEPLSQGSRISPTSDSDTILQLLQQCKEMLEELQGELELQR